MAGVSPGQPGGTQGELLNMLYIAKYVATHANMHGCTYVYVCVCMSVH